MNRAVVFCIHLLLIAVACLPLTTHAQAVETGSISLWKVHQDHTTIYLFGSIHFARSDFYPLDSRIEKAFAESSALAVEIDMNPDTLLQTQQMIQTQGMYQGNDNLLAHLDAETSHLLQRYSEKNQLPLPNLIRFKPGILSMSLSAMQFTKLGFSAEYGLDLHFLNQARGKKRIIELESFESQLALLLDENYDKLTLRYTLLSLDNVDTELDKLIQAWRNGQSDQMDLLAIQQPLQEAPELKPLFEKLYTERNQAMLLKIEQLLKEGTNCFVVVGSAHLVGKQGLVQSLQRKGYTVNPL